MSMGLITEETAALASEARQLAQRITDISEELSRNGVSTEMHVNRLHIPGQEIQRDHLSVRVNAPVGEWW